MRAGHALILTTIGLLTLGVVMVNSAGMTIAGTPFDPQRILFGRHAAFALLAIALMFVASRIPLDDLYRLRGARSPIPWIAAISLALLLAVHLPGIGREVNGARRWIHLGPIGFQPSEVVKWGILFVIAWHGARRAGALGRFGTGFAAPMLLVGLLCALIATEDLGTAALIGIVGVAMLIAAGVQVWHAALLLPVGIAGFIAAVTATPYRIDRLRAFLDPYEDPQGIGYHVLQSMAAVSGGGIAGHGLGNGIQKFGYLPEDTTDFIFAIVAEELGVAGASLVIGLYLVLLVAGYRVVVRTGHPFRRLLAMGILLTIGLQALMNLLVVTGLAPTKGIALPLVSSGGTGWCLTAFCIGLLVSMDRDAARGAIGSVAGAVPQRDPDRPVPVLS